MSRLQILLYLCLALHVSAFKFSFRESQKSKCKTSKNVRDFLHDSETMRIATTNWVKTHQVRDWKVSSSMMVTNPARYPMIHEYNIPFKTKNQKPMFYMYTTYSSSVHLPKILKTVMKTTIDTDTTKHSFVVGNREYKVVKISNVPVINFITIYSKSVYLSDGTIFTSHDIEAGNLPFWAAWARRLMKKLIQSSATDFQRQIAIDICQS